MENPWFDLPQQAPFIAAADQTAIDSKEFKRLKENWYNFKLFPDPFVGNLDTAQVIFLSNNPRISSNDWVNLQSPVFLRESLKSIRQESDARFFYWLDELRDTDGHAYWQTLLGKTVATAGITTQQLMRNMMQIEFIGYHSPTYKHTRIVLPSQEYSFALTREAMRRGKLVIVMRGAKYWFAAIPELMSYKNTIQLDSWQNTTISRNNMKGAPAGSYDRVVQALSH